jgi:hypothetical protein
MSRWPAPRLPRRGVPGQLDWRQLADQRRPRDPDLLAHEIRRLSRNGLRPRDIADALRLPLPAVLEVLYDTFINPSTTRR